MRIMSIDHIIQRFIDASGNIMVIIGGLVFISLLLGFLIIRKFYFIWQAEVEKNKIFKELIRHYEIDAGSKQMEDHDSSS